MIPKRPLHVLSDRLGRWRVQREGDHQPLSQHDSETEAELAAAENEARSR
jgi:hypothetical protein